MHEKLLVLSLVWLFINKIKQEKLEEFCFVPICVKRRTINSFVPWILMFNWQIKSQTRIEKRTGIWTNRWPSPSDERLQLNAHIKPIATSILDLMELQRGRRNSDKIRQHILWCCRERCITSGVGALLRCPFSQHIHSTKTKLLKHKQLLMTKKGMQMNEKQRNIEHHKSMQVVFLSWKTY